MPEEIAVVKPYYATEEAYKMGYRRFENADPVDGDDAEGDAVTALSHFMESAEYANSIAPKLRAMSGFADRGRGTWTEDRKVAAVDPGCEEDTPADATLTDSKRIFETDIHPAFRMGALDALTGDSFDPDATLA